MAFLAQLWLPIVVSAVAVFLLSAASHLLVPLRRSEWGHLPGQDALQGAVRGAAPGLYAFPLPSDPGDRGKPEALQRFAAGPAGWLAVLPPGPVRMGRNLARSLLVNLFVSAVTAHLAAHALGRGASGNAVIRLVGSVGTLAYGVGPLYEGIWFWKPWRSFAMTALDAVASGAAMAVVFAWLW